MEMTVDDNAKTVEIYLKRSEKNDPDIQGQLKDIYARFRGTKYTVAVYESGDKDLYENTLALLSYNKRRLAELEVRRAREANNAPA